MIFAPLALGLRLTRHRALHPAGDLDVLDLDDRDLDPPRGRGLVDDRLENLVDLLALLGMSLFDTPTMIRAQVNCAICDVATMKFSTWTIAAFGSTIRKYATALTLTGTLSLVMTSCGGMFSVIVRRSTRTIRSMIGISRNSPGPFGGSSSRPRRKTTPRSYSRATLTADARKMITSNAARAAMISAAVIAIPARSRLRWRNRFPQTLHWSASRTCRSHG